MFSHTVVQSAAQNRPALQARVLNPSPKPAPQPPPTKPSSPAWAAPARVAPASSTADENAQAHGGALPRGVSPRPLMLAPARAAPIAPPSAASTAESAQDRRAFVLDDFQVGRKLGEGLFGTAYLARCRRASKLVVLKVVYKAKVEQHGAVHQLRREIEIHSRLQHPHVVRMYAYFHDATRVYMVLEYAPGGTLFTALSEAPERRFSEARAATVMRQLCSALATCHRLQIVHRDIKPENVLLGASGEVKLADFGWCVASRARDGRRELRKTMCGTVDYLPPEMIEDAPYDESADVWMVGVLLYEMLVGAAPFTSERAFDLYEKVAQCSYEVPPHVSRGASALIARVLVKDPAKRPRMADVLRDPWLVGQ